ncbi:hypothetical protein QJQ45_025772 [Haematococcus lacustris]|nr:hypothetical protein QJQ45_025772 [Haematococcus lacustris]
MERGHVLEAVAEVAEDEYSDYSECSGAPDTPEEGSPQPPVPARHPTGHVDVAFLSSDVDYQHRAGIGVKRAAVVAEALDRELQTQQKAQMAQLRRSLQACALPPIQPLEEQLTREAKWRQLCAGPPPPLAVTTIYQPPGLASTNAAATILRPKEMRRPGAIMNVGSLVRSVLGKASKLQLTFETLCAAFNAGLRMRRAAAAGGDFSRSTQQPSHRGDPSASGDNAGRPTGSRASRAASAASTVGASVRPPPRQPWSAEPGPASPTAAMAMSNLRHERSLAGMQLQGLGSAARPDHLTPVNEMMAKSSRAKSSPAGVQENGEPKWAEDPMSSLLQLPMVQTGAWQDYVHAVVWRVGRQFGFQAFNMNPGSRGQRSRVWVPATLFLASDHLVSLLIKNIYIRDKVSATEEERFARAVWALHGSVFSNYEDMWCRRLELSPRPNKLERLADAAFTEHNLLHGLLCELALYFLMYTEGTNLRHMPEATWFLYYCAAHSAHMQALWEAGPPLVVAHARTRRVAMRNALQHEISSLQSQFQHDPNDPSVTPRDCFAALAFMEGKVPVPTADKVAAVCSSDPELSGGVKAASQHNQDFSSGDMACYEDLIAMGDGSFWCERVITPIFYVLCFEMDAQFTAGVEVAFRLGYDDINESLNTKPIVMATLRLLGAGKQAIRQGDGHDAHENITRLGFPSYDHHAGPEPGSVAATQQPQEGEVFDAERAAVFWSSKVFVKTYRERRSWAAMLRAFYRVYSMHLVLFHLMVAYAWAGSDVKYLSTAVLTHALMHFIERGCNWWMCRPQPNPLGPNKLQPGSWTTSGMRTTPKAARKSRKRDAESGAAADGLAKRDSLVPIDPLAQAAIEREQTCRQRSIVVEGAPVWGVLGFVEWGLVLLGLVVLFAAQFLDSGLQAMAKSYWPLAAGGYTALMLGHALITTRDGYSVSLTSMLRLPRVFAASSARPAASYWLDGSLSIGWKQSGLLLGFWLQVAATKIAFDYFVIVRPMVGPIRAVLRHNWLPCANERYTIMGTELPLTCIDGDWLLVFVRTLPFLMVCMVDTHVFYQVTLVVWGVVRGLCVLDIGVVGDWSSLVSEFHQGPARWWANVMSVRGNSARRSLVALKRTQAANGITRGASMSGDDESDSAVSFGTIAASSISASDTSDTDVNGGRSVPGLAVMDAARARLSASQLGDGLSGKGSKLAAKAAVKRASKGRGKGGNLSSGTKAKRLHADLALMLQGQDDEHVAMWDAFASAWDEIVADLREGDLVSDREADNLRFTRLCYDQGLEASGVRPILMPAFFFAGQMQRVVDTGLVDTAQGLVLGEARRLLVWLGAHLGLLGTPAVTAMLGCSLLPEVQDAAHQQSRERMLRACVRLLGAVAEVGMTARTPADLRRRQSLHAEAVLALCEVLSCLEVECQAVRLVAGGSNTRRGPGSRRNKWGFGAAEVTAAESLLAVAQAMRSQLEVDPTPISACLRALHDQEDDLGQHGPISQGSGISGTSSNMSGLCDATMVQKAVSVLLKMLTLTPAAARPQSTEAQRLLTFFMSSLANKQLAKPVALDEMLSWTVLTPCYEEDVLYPLSMSHAASQTGCPDPSAPTAGGPGPHALAGARPAAAGMSDLLTESEDQVSLMAFLRSVFPDDWEHFKERLGSRLGVNLQAVSEEAFAPAGPLADLALELQLWASFRGQLLARTVRGMMSYDKALRVLARLEQPCPPNMARSQYDAWIDDLVSSKFSYVVSSQVYGRNRNARELRNRWLAEGVDVLLEVYDKLKVAFLDFAPLALGGPNGAVTPAGTACGGALAQYSVLIQGRRGPPAAWESAEFVCAQRVEELYRVRLPHNRYSQRGVVIGEGKPENQNHAIIFCLGEGLQTIDMNQDNCLAEAFKMRNMLGELEPEVNNARAVTAPLALLPNASGRDMQRALVKKRRAEKPTAIVGFCEDIFSDKAGALGSFAAAAEFAFGTIVQRTMDTPGNVRMHYGHPDLMNKLHIITRGGPSKATRQLHISEDIFGGFNHTLRGGRIKYREYMRVGKGRDMGLDSINAFEIKISGGAGEVMISRDLWRLASRLDPVRLLHFYHSGMGYYVVNWLIMHTVYAQIFALVFFALARADAIYTVTTTPPLNPRDPNSKPVQTVTMYDALRVENVLQLGMLSLIPYIAELALEHGFLRAFAILIQQIVAGSFAFFIFKQQTTAFYFFDDMAHGGAQYIGTGRGFSLTTSQFLKVWTNYARSHIYLGVELLSLAILMYFFNNCEDCYVGGLTWGTFLVAASLIFSPFWFNPMTFSVTKVKRDFGCWAAWLRGEVDPGTGTSWHTWNRKQLSRLRNDRGHQTSHWGNVILAVITQCSPLLLLTLAAVSRLDVSITVGPSLLRSPYLTFIIFTLIIWLLLGLTIKASARFHNAANRRSWRLYSFWVAVVCVLFIIGYLVGLSQFYSGSGIQNLGLILYANLNLLAVVHRAATQMATRTPAARAFVDAGFLALDCVIGYILLAVLALLSFIGIVGWLQNLLLFNPTFAKSIRRGQLVRTIGLTKADQAALQPHSPTLENAVGAAVVAAPPPTAVPRSRAVNLVNARMQQQRNRRYVDDVVSLDRAL